MRRRVKLTCGLLLVLTLGGVSICAQQNVALTNEPVSISPASSFAAGIRLFKRRDYDQAAKIFSTLALHAAKSELSAEVYLYLGKSLFNLNRFTEAEAALQRFVALAPGNDDGYYTLAATLFRLGRAHDSLAVFERAAKLKTPTVDDIKIIALNYVLLGDNERAAHHLEQVLAIVPESTEARYYLGRVRFTQNDFQAAVKLFYEILQRDPQHAKAQNNLGQSLEALNVIDEAIIAYRRAIELERIAARPSELPFLNLGTLLGQRGETSEAVKLLERAVAVNSQSAKARFELGKLYLTLGRKADAERELVEATRLDPKDVGARYQLGQLYHRQGRKDLANRELQISERLRAGLQTGNDKN